VLNMSLSPQIWKLFMQNLDILVKMYLDNPLLY